MAIIAILAAILMPALSTARERGRRTVCLNNLRQNTLGFILYGDANDSYLPASPFISTFPVVHIGLINRAVWPQFQEYGMTEGTFSCPSRPLWNPIAADGTYPACYETSYACTFGLNPHGSASLPASLASSPSRISEGAEQVMMADVVYNETSYLSKSNSGLPTPNYFNHSGNGMAGNSQSFLDGHVEWMPRDRYPAFLRNGVTSPGNATVTHHPSVDYSWWWVTD